MALGVGDTFGMRSVFVVSDLHLGGEPGFQMCTARGQGALTRFFKYVAGFSGAQLVLNGDIVDFLAEPSPAGGHAKFVSDDRAARLKLQAIIDRTRPVWTALADAAQAGELTMLLGNHDLELCLPGCHQLLRETLGPFELRADNQALALGPVLVEHGNRADGWNRIDHDTLRQVRSALSRREPPPEFEPPPGTHLVIDVMNGLKGRFPFVDLLKPEVEGVLPILVAIDPSVARHVLKIAKLRAQAGLRGRDDAFGRPRQAGDIAFDDDGPGLALARRLAGDGEISFVDDASEILVEPLRDALRHWADDHAACFDTARESDEYLGPARQAFRRRFEVVVYGHTHLAKRVRDGETGGLYLNTGTWAELMRVPRAVLEGDPSGADGALRGFLDDLRHDRLDAYRAHLPTFARIDLDGDDRVVDADVWLFEDPPRRLPDGPLEALLY